MTGLCCRCQVRHDDWLCCEHGVEHRGDIGDDTLLGVQRPAPVDPHHVTITETGGWFWLECPTCGPFGRPELRGDAEAIAARHEQVGGFERGLADVGTIVLAAVGGAILAACLWLGYHGSDWPKVIAALGLAVAGALVLVWIGGQEQRSVDDHPASWSSRSPIRADHEPRRRVGGS